MYAKLKNAQFDFTNYKNNILKYGDVQVINPTETDLKNAGYKLVIETDMPVKDGFYYTLVYTENEENIFQNWEEHMNEVMDGEI